jgi:hypothetical protein
MKPAVSEAGLLRQILRGWSGLVRKPAVAPTRKRGVQIFCKTSQALHRMLAGPGPLRQTAAKALNRILFFFQIGN